MASVDIGIGHDDDLAVVDVLDLEVGVEASSDRVDQGGDVLVSQKGLLVLDVGRVLGLSAQRKDGLVLGVSSLLGAAAGGVALDDEELVLAVVLA